METHSTKNVEIDLDLISFNDSMKKDLRITSHWSKFISIFSLIIMTLSLLGYILAVYQSYAYSGLTFSEIVIGFPSGFYMFFIFITGVLVLLTLAAMALLNFSFEIRKAIDQENTIALNNAIELLLKFFRYSGVLIIAILGASFLIYLYFIMIF